MIDLQKVCLVHYCHPNCRPFQNIMRLPEAQAFAKADELARENPGETAFGRFADFENYYPLRQKADEKLYASFVRLGGRPVQRHPLSFVLQGSDFLHHWFGDGPAVALPLLEVPAGSVSFTRGDSMQEAEELPMLTKAMLLQELQGFAGTLDAYMRAIEKQYFYIEAQLWDDKVVRGF